MGILGVFLGEVGGTVCGIEGFFVANVGAWKWGVLIDIYICIGIGLGITDHLIWYMYRPVVTVRVEWSFCE
jgi:hypothetical protein